jgi:16S rRNA (cytidine1402-2'-O)-methyltransferase
MLYVVATPIGNLSELPPRAVDTLRTVDFIAAEDTRVTAVLLNRHGIRKPMTAYHKFNEDTAAAKILEKLRSGASAALLSDAGTPCISDPGYILVQKAVDAGITVTTVAGPSAAITALSVSGFPALSFAFYGFLPKENAKIGAVLQKAGLDSAPVAVFYLSPHRLQTSGPMHGCAYAMT